MESPQRFSSVDDYLASLAPGPRQILETIRRCVQEALPDATEGISYQIPAFRQQKVFFHFAAFKQHIGIYPPLRASSLDAELAPYRGPKGNL